MPKNAPEWVIRLATEIVQGISALSTGSLVAVPDTMNVNTEQPVFPFEAFLNFIFHIWAIRSLLADQYNCNAGALQLSVYPRLYGCLTLSPDRFPSSGIHECIRLAFLKQQTITDLAYTPTVQLVMETKKYSAGHKLLLSNTTALAIDPIALAFADRRAKPTKYYLQFEFLDKFSNIHCPKNLPIPLQET